MATPLPPWYHTIRPAPSDDLHGDGFRLPKTYPHRPGEWYFIGQLADALGRSPGTLRRWEVLGWLPPSPFVEHGVEDFDGTECTSGRRRLYSAEMIAQAVDVAEQEGLSDTLRCCPGRTQFAQLLEAAWAQTSTEYEALDSEDKLPEAECVEAPWRPTPWAELSRTPLPRQPWLLPPGR